MATKMIPSRLLFAACSLLTLATVASAQEISGTPGSPSATTTIDGKYLPNPPPKFGGQIGLGAKDSKPYWPPTVVPPKGAPNVLLIMTDDAGYGVSGTFGGVIPTPAMDRIAQAGLRYTQFHSTALCSPTRAALITGRNHHSVGLRRDHRAVHRLSGLRLHHRPGQRHHRRDPEGERLRHVVVRQEPQHAQLSVQPGGPFDQWPSGMGFEYFYGFMGGETDQWTPYLFRNTPRSFRGSASPATTSPPIMADEAIKHMQTAQRGRAGQAVLPLLRARRHPRAAPADAGMDREVQGQVRHGLERHARADLRQPEAARRDPGEHAADALAGRPAEVGHARRRREEAVRPPGGGLRRLRRLHRPRDRPRDPGGGGPGQARQHADHLHQRRQRHQRRRLARSARRSTWPRFKASMFRSRSS